jgi:hypothetical protein
VSCQSGARMLHCCPYRESNTQIEEGGKNQGIRFTQPTIITRIYVYRYIICPESSPCVQCKQTQAYARESTDTHTHTHTLTHTPHTSSLTHVGTSACTHKHTREICPQDRKHIKHTHNDIIPKVWLEAQQRLLRPPTLVAEGLLH